MAGDVAMVQFCPTCGLRIETEVTDGELTCSSCNTLFTVGSELVGSFEPGERLGGFEIRALIGSGGMGEVYLANQLSLDRPVALKILSQKHRGNREVLQRFLLEVRATASLEHPNIVSLFEAGEENGVCFLATAFVDGESLEKTLARDGRLEELYALQIAAKVAEALDYAWRKQKLLHRDIKPANIMVDKRGEVRLCDLGIAKRPDDEFDITKQGIAIGTPHYMSPEQARGRMDLDFRSDIYSLGATLYHLLTGDYLFDSNNVIEVLTQHIQSPPEPARKRNPALSKQCEALLDIMLSKHPDDRHDSWPRLIEDIDRVIEGKAPSYLPPHQESTAVETPVGASQAAAQTRQPPEKEPTAPPPLPETGTSGAIWRALALMGILMLTILALAGMIYAVHGSRRPDAQLPELPLPEAPGDEAGDWPEDDDTAEPPLPDEFVEPGDGGPGEVYDPTEVGAPLDPPELEPQPEPEPQPEEPARTRRERIRDSLFATRMRDLERQYDLARREQDKARILQNLGDVCVRFKEYEQAVAYYQRVVTEHGDLHDGKVRRQALRSLATCYQRLGDEKAWVSTLKSLLEEDHGSHDAVMAAKQLAEYYRQQGEVITYGIYLKRIIRDYPGPHGDFAADASFELARSYEERGLNSMALDTLETVVRKFPGQRAEHAERAKPEIARLKRLIARDHGVKTGGPDPGGPIREWLELGRKIRALKIKEPSHDLRRTRAMTLSVWVFVKDVPAGREHLVSRQFGSRGFNLFADGGGWNWEVYHSQGRTLLRSPRQDHFPTGEWVHLEASAGDGRAALYVNGTRVATAEIGKLTNDGAGTLVVGQSAEDTAAFSGYVQYLSVYTKVLHEEARFRPQVQPADDPQLFACLIAHGDKVADAKKNVTVTIVPR